MDPNATLMHLREMVRQVEQFDSETAQADLNELAQYVRNLDEWLTKGGFKPAAWETPTDRVWVARGVHMFGYTADGALEEFAVDVLVNDWSDGTRSTSLQEHDKTKWSIPAPLIEETG